MVKKNPGCGGQSDKYIIAFGCTLKADISPLASEPNIREYKVEVEYRTKADAKAAVVCLAAEQGLIDLLRFNGAQPPPDYTPFWEAQVNGTGDNYVGKRKDTERDLDGEGRDRKKRRKSNKDSEPGEVPDVKVKQDFEHPLPSSTVNISSSMTGPSPPKPIRKKPSKTGPIGLGSTNTIASATATVSQHRFGNRSGGLDHHHRYPNYPSSQPTTSSPSVMLPPHVVYGAGPSFQSGPAPMFTSSDHYQGAYASYSPAIQGHPYQQATPHTLYPYFTVPSSPTHPSVPPTHMPYAHYPYPHQYQQPYPHNHYPVNYGPHPPVMYQTGPAIIPVSAYPPVPVAAPIPPPPYSKFTSSPPPSLESTRSPPRPSHHRSDEVSINKSQWSSTSDSRSTKSYSRHQGNNNRIFKKPPSIGFDQGMNDGSSPSKHRLSYHIGLSLTICIFIGTTAKVTQNRELTPQHSTAHVNKNSDQDVVPMPNNEIETKTTSNLALLYGMFVPY